MRTVNPNNLMMEEVEYMEINNCKEIQQTTLEDIFEQCEMFNITDEDNIDHRKVKYRVIERFKQDITYEVENLKGLRDGQAGEKVVFYDPNDELLINDTRTLGRFMYDGVKYTEYKTDSNKYIAYIYFENGNIEIQMNI